MTLQDAVRILRTMKPNQYEEQDFARWLSDLDGQIYREVMLTHMDPPEAPPLPYRMEEHMARELLVDDPYADMYIKYLSAQVDYHNGEYDRYNNAMMMYNTIYQAFVNAYNRDKMPRQDHCIAI